MKHPGSVSCWLNALKNDTSWEEPTRKIWERYFEQLLTVAGRRLTPARRGCADEEDVVLEAFDSFFRGVRAGRFSRLENRHDLWHILGVLTARKAVNAAKKEQRLKRGGGKARVGHNPHDSRDMMEAAVPASPELSPDLAAIATEEVQRLLRDLGDDQLRDVAVWRMEGYTNAEIAERIGRKERTVERKLKIIRSQWMAEVDGRE
jgi:DNA-directed RNA polymerase specialized sigma24 family protein